MHDAKHQAQRGCQSEPSSPVLLELVDYVRVHHQAERDRDQHPHQRAKENPQAGPQDGSLRIVGDALESSTEGLKMALVHDSHQESGS